MQIGIISDIHDQIKNLQKALKMLANADAIVCCGDLCSPFIVDELGVGFTKEMHIVFGNNDGDHFRITQKAAAYEQLTLHGEFCELEFSDRRFAVNHFDNIGLALAKSEQYDVVCFGHNHQLEIRKEGNTIVINPGEILGALTGKSSFVVYDTALHEATSYIVD